MCSARLCADAYADVLSDGDRGSLSIHLPLEFTLQICHLSQDASSRGVSSFCCCPPPQHKPVALLMAPR